MWTRLQQVSHPIRALHHRLRPHQSSVLISLLLSPVLPCAVSLENVLCDVKELQRGMELTWREFSVQHNAILKDFISRHESRLSKLLEDARIAEVRHAHHGGG